jgi:hypothetical protein
MTIVYTAPGEATIVRVAVAVPSAQPKKTDLVSAEAAGGCTLSVQVTPLLIVNVIGAVYAPEGHPEPDTPNATGVLESIRTSGATSAKLAVIVFGASTTIVSGFVVPVAEALHPVNRYPAAGVAVNCTLEPAG